MAWSFSVFTHMMNLYSCVPSADLEMFDQMAINGRNTDLPKFKDHESVLALCGHFAPVFRKRVDPLRGVQPEKDENGEDIWIVGTLGEMPRSKMLELAREYIGRPSRWRR